MKTWSSNDPSLMGQQQSIILDHIYNISATCNNSRNPIKFIQLNALFVQLTQLNTTHRNSRNLSDVVIPVLFDQPFGHTHDSSKLKLNWLFLLFYKGSRQKNNGYFTVRLTVRGGGGVTPPWPYRSICEKFKTFFLWNMIP